MMTCCICATTVCTVTILSSMLNKSVIGDYYSKVYFITHSLWFCVFVTHCLRVAGRKPTISMAS